MRIRKLLGLSSGAALRGRGAASDGSSRGGMVEEPFSTYGQDKDSCENCEAAISPADGHLPWEDGDNPYAYIECPRCGHENIRYGFGEDD